MIFSTITAIATGIGGLLTSTFLSGGLGTLLLKAAVGIGINLAAQAIAGQPEGPSFAVQGKLQSGGDVPRSFPLGFTATAGSLVYANTWGNAGKTPNAYLTQVIALSDLPIGGLVELWVNGEKVTLPAMTGTAPYDQGWPIAQYAKGSDNNLWIKFYDGTQTVADPFLVSKVSSTERPYESTRVGRGVAYAIVTSQVKEDLFTGFPSFKFAVNGAKLYDLSKDSTAGGSGAHRWSDPSTWGGDGDYLPAVQMYNLGRGITYAGQWFYGLQGVTAARLPAAHWIGQIQKCRAPITSGGATVPTYRSGGEVAVSAQLGDAFQGLLTTCQARLSEAGGVYKIFVGAPGAAVASIDDGVIISTDEQSFTPFFGLADTINGITAKHPNPAEGWNVKVAPPIYRADLEALSGNRRLLADVSFDFVPYADQVQRLMKSAIEEAQRARRHTFVLPPEYWVLEPGDVISWTSARNGYVTKLFRVDGVIDRANLDVMVDLTEVDPNDYDWNDGTDYRVPVDGPVGPNRPAAQPIVDWYVEASSIPDNTGTGRRPAILLSWDGDQVDVEAVAFEIRLATSGIVVYRGRTDSVVAGSILISQSVLPLATYEVRGRYIARSDRETLWSGWLGVTTLDIRLGAGDFYPIDIEQLSADIREMQKWIGKGVRDLIAEAQQFALRTADQDAANYRDKKQILIELKSTSDGITAAYLEAITVATGPSSAIVQRLTTLEATIPTLATASAVSLLSTRVTKTENGIVANADAITALTTTVNGVSANATFRMGTGYTPGAGYTSRIGLEARINNTSATFRAAGLFIDATATVARVILTADQVAIQAGGTIAALFASGTTFIDTARIRNLTATNITAQSIDSPSLAFNAVTDRNSETASSTDTGTYGSWVTITSFTIANPNPNPVFCQVVLRARAVSTSGGGSSAGTATRWINVTTGQVLASIGAASTAGSVSDNSFDGFFLDDSPSAQGNYTYALQRQHTSGGGTLTSCINSGTVKMIWWKR